MQEKLSFILFYDDTKREMKMIYILIVKFFFFSLEFVENFY